MTSRSYNQYCGVARALDLVGERWALLVVRDLVLGPKRFTDLKLDLPGIGTNVLATRLRQLEHGGVVHRRELPPPSASTVYELTEYGRRLEPILLALGRWGAETLGERAPQQTLRSGWLAVALRAYFSPSAAAGLRATVEIRLRDGTYRARFDDGSLTIERGPGDADLWIDVDDEVLIGFLAGAPIPPGAIEAEGDESLLRRLPALFPFGV